MNYQYKTKNSLKETTDRQEDEKELLQDRPGSSDPKSQEKTEEDMNDTSETRDIRFEVSQLKLNWSRTSRKPLPLSLLSADAPPFVHQSFQETSLESSLTKTGSINIEQGIKPSSLCDRRSAASTSHMTAQGKQSSESSCSRSKMTSLESVVEFEPESCSEPKILLPPASIHYVPCSLKVFRHQKSKRTDQGSVMSPTSKLSELQAVSLQHDEDGSDEPSTFSSTMISPDPQPQDVNVCEPLRNESTSPNKDITAEQQLEERSLRLVFTSLSSSPSSLSPPVDLDLNYEVSQTKVEQSSISLAETNEESEQLTETHSSEVKELLDLVKTETLFKKLKEETNAGFLWGTGCNPAVNNTDGTATSAVRAEYMSATISLPPSSSLQVSSSSSTSSCCLTRSHSAPSLSKIAKNNIRRAASLPKRTDQGSVMSPTSKLSELQAVSLQHDEDGSDEPSTFSSTMISPDPQPQDVNVCEPLRNESTSPNKDITAEQQLEERSFRLVFTSLSSSPSSLSPPVDLDLNYEVSQTKVEQSSISLAETNEESEQLTETHSSEVKELLDLVKTETVFEKLEEETNASFLWGAECNPAVNDTDGAATSAVRAEYVSATVSLPPSSSLQVSSSSCCLTRSHSAPSLSKIAKNVRRAASLPDVTLQEFTPAISADDCDDETYRFQCSCPGLYQCSVSGLVFNMKGEGDVLYWTVPWNRRLLAQHHKKPAGPLFEIKCLQQSVCQLHLPHCEIISTGGGRSLQVAHVSDEGVEFIGPQQVTETHVVLNISGFSAYGNVKDEDSPPDPVRALVLLFYNPPQDPDLRSVLSVLMLPRNIVFRKIRRDRRKSDKNERYIETSSCCCLQPKQVYSLSTSPEDNLIKVQPKEAEFDDEHHESYFPSFQVVLKRILTDVNLTLRHSSSSSCVWERVCLLPTGVKTLDAGPKKIASDLRSCFIRRISGPVLSSLLDHLQEKRVITDAEREEADAKQSRGDRARLVFDTVSNKGEAARSEMMEFLCEEDPFLSEHLGLKHSGEKAS